MIWYRIAKYVLEIVDQEVYVPEIPLVRKKIFLATVVEVGNSCKGYKVETGGDDFVFEDVASKNSNGMTGAVEMLSDSQHRANVPGCRHCANKNMAQNISSKRHKGNQTLARV